MATVSPTVAPRSAARRLISSCVATSTRTLVLCMQTTLRQCMHAVGAPPESTNRCPKRSAASAAGESKVVGGQVVGSEVRRQVLDRGTALPVGEQVLSGGVGVHGGATYLRPPRVSSPRSEGRSVGGEVVEGEVPVG